MASEKKQILGGMFWKMAERVSSQGVTFLISIILARLLSPSEYGVIALVNIFIVLANIFVTNGFSASLIQNKNADALDFSTNLYCSLGVSCILYTIIYFSSPFIAEFYGIPELTLITRVYSLSIFLYSFNSIQQAWVSRHLVFKKFFYATFCASVGSGVIGIVLAYNGYGVWALVYQYLSNILISMLVLKFIVPWKPEMIFSWERAKGMLKYGGQLMATGFVGNAFNQLRSLLIGKFYSTADLALFNRGEQFPGLISNNVNITVSSVLFPVLANHSDDLKRIKELTRRSIKTSSFFLFFFMTMLAVVAYPLVKVLLTDKWIQCVPFMQIMCLDAMLGIVSTVNMQTLKAIGRSDVLLRLELYKKPVFFLMLIISVNINVSAIAWSMPIYTIYSNYMNMKPNTSLIGYSMKEQLRDYLPVALIALIVFVVCYPLSFLAINEYIQIVLQIISCSILFIGLAWIFRLDSFQYILELFKEKFR